jgi:hypothetical protein
MSNAVKHTIPKEMADVLDRIVKDYGQSQGINNRNQLITKILSTFLEGAAEEKNGNDNLVSR